MNVIKLVSKIRDWHRSREAINELLARSDRELGDIGLQRMDIVRAVRGDARANGR